MLKFMEQKLFFLLIIITRKHLGVMCCVAANLDALW